MSKTENTDAPISLLESFQNMGMFASKEVQRDTIELDAKHTAAFYVRALPDVEFRKLWADGDRAKLIAACICDKDGKPVMTVAKAGELSPVVAAKFQTIALKHSGFGDAEATKEEAGNG